MSDELVKRHVEQLRMTGGMYEHPGYRKPYPIQTVLRDLASQEGCDGEPYDAMVFAASYIDCIIAHIAALTAQVAEAREQRADAEARMETAEVERDRLREALTDAWDAHNKHGDQMSGWWVHDDALKGESQ